MEPEGLGKGKTDINEESGYVGKDRNIPEEVILAKKKKKQNYIKGTLCDISHHRKYEG